MVTKTKTQNCVAHHWHIEENRQPTSKAVCIHCGETAEFYNVVNREVFKNIKVKTEEDYINTFIVNPYMEQISG